MMVFEGHLNEEVVPPSMRCPDRKISEALENVILRALEKDPAIRHLDADIFAAAVDRSLPPGCSDGWMSPGRVAFSTTAPTREWVHAHELLHPRRRFAEGTRRTMTHRRSEAATWSGRRSRRPW